MKCLWPKLILPHKLIFNLKYKDLARNIDFDMKYVKEIWSNSRRDWIKNQVDNQHQTHCAYGMDDYDDKGNFKSNICKCLQIHCVLCVVNIIFLSIIFILFQQL